MYIVLDYNSSLCLLYALKHRTYNCHWIINVMLQGNGPCWIINISLHLQRIYYRNCFMMSWTLQWTFYVLQLARHSKHRDLKYKAIHVLMVMQYLQILQKLDISAWIFFIPHWTVSKHSIFVGFQIFKNKKEQLLTVD